MPRQTFHRPELAREMAEAVLGRRAFGGHASGLFLANPRRTGKTTFVLADLAPALENLGVLVVYVDLWSDKTTSAGTLIARAVASALDDQRNLLSRAARKLGLTKVAVHGVEAGIERHPAGQDATLFDLLGELRARAGRDLALVVDEAQHALTHPDGMAVMQAIQSARDRMNRPGEVHLAVVMIGSDRDRLCRLVNTNRAPFLGARVTPMPLLGRDYVASIAGRIRADRPGTAVDVDRLFAAFRDVGSRPGIFRDDVIGPVTGAFRPTDRPFHDALEAKVAEVRARDATRYRDDFQSLTPAQRAVLTRLLEEPGRSMFGKAALDQYARLLGKPVQPPTVQAALRSLRERESPLVWKSDRGDYALEDAGMRAWYQRLVEHGEWPPGSAGRGAI